MPLVRSPGPAGYACVYSLLFFLIAAPFLPLLVGRGNRGVYVCATATLHSSVHGWALQVREIGETRAKCIQIADGRKEGRKGNRFRRSFLHPLYVVKMKPAANLEITEMLAA